MIFEKLMYNGMQIASAFVKNGDNGVTGVCRVATLKINLLLIKLAKANKILEYTKVILFVCLKEQKCGLRLRSNFCN
jgi:hypothetical protein